MPANERHRERRLLGDLCCGQSRVLVVVAAELDESDKGMELCERAAVDGQLARRQRFVADASGEKLVEHRGAAAQQNLAHDHARSA